MGTNAEELSTTPADIEATRADLTRDLDELTDKVSPQRVIERRKEATRNRIGSVRDKVMGSAQHATSAVGSRTPDVSASPGAAVGTVRDSAGSAVDSLESATAGNPLVAGAVAFGAGMLISALLPASRAETEAARRATDAVQEHAQPLVDQARSVGSDIGQDLKESAAQSAAEVKETAAQGASRVKDEGTSSAQEVKGSATP